MVTKTTEQEETKMSKKFRTRSLQVSMSQEQQHLCHILAAISGSTVSGMINTILEPYLKFVIDEVLSSDGYVDEYGRFLIDPERLREIYKNDKGVGTNKYLKIIEEYINENAQDILSLTTVKDGDDIKVKQGKLDDLKKSMGLRFDFLSPSSLV